MRDTRFTVTCLLIAARVASGVLHALPIDGADLNRLSQRLFRAADKDHNNALDKSEVEILIQTLNDRGHHRVPNGDEVSMMYKIAGDDQLLQLDEFTPIVEYVLRKQSLQRAYVGQNGTMDVALERKAFTCFANAPVFEDGVQVLCQPPPTLRVGPTSTSSYADYTQEVMTRRLALPEGEAETRERLMDECLFAHPFPPARARFATPFSVCTRLIALPDETLYWPEDTSTSNPDCEMLPMLLELAVAGPGRGVAADVGASRGNCGFFMMSAGHTVHFFDSALGIPDSPESDIVGMTLDVNRGWRDRAHLHGSADASGESSLDQVFALVPELHLLKIDVDEIQFQRDVLHGADELLNRTEIVQMELITEEIQMEGKYEFLNKFLRTGFDPYVVIGVRKGKPDSNYVRNQPEDMQNTAWRDLVTLGQTVLEYGALHIDMVYLSPLCLCGQERFADPSQEHKLLIDGKQFAFVRRSAKAMHGIQGKFGSCATKCATPVV